MCQGVPGIPEMTCVPGPGPDPRAKRLKHLGELNNVPSKLEERGFQFIPMSFLLPPY